MTKCEIEIILDEIDFLDNANNIYETKTYLVRQEVSIEIINGITVVYSRDTFYAKTSLRMRPDRIIVGEVRGKEVIDMIQAMNTGHDGSLSTGHGNSIRGMLRRLESMFLQAADYPIEAIRSQIAEGLDIIIHLGRLSDGSRKVLEIAEIDGIHDGEIGINPLFRYKVSKGLLSTGNGLKNKEKLELRGLLDGN